MRNEIVDITLSQLKKYSIMLAREIHEAGYFPEHVLYVERAGLFPGAEIATYFRCTMSGIAASRSGTSVKSGLKFLLRYLPRSATHFLRNLEIKSNMHGIKNERNVYVEHEMPPEGKRLLVVDDAIDTGNSLKAVVDFLLERGYKPNHIRKAVLTTTNDRPLYRADDSLFECCFAFPWACDSREYNAAWRRYHKMKDTLT